MVGRLPIPGSRPQRERVVLGCGVHSAPNHVLSQHASHGPGGIKIDDELLLSRQGLSVEEFRDPFGELGKILDEFSFGDFE